MPSRRRGAGGQSTGPNDPASAGALWALQTSVAELTDEVRTLKSELVVSGGPNDPPAARHLKRFAPFYALVTIWILMLAFFPSAPRTTELSQVSGSQDTDGSVDEGADSALYDDGAAGGAQAPSGPADPASAPGAPATGTEGGQKPPSADPAAAAAQAGKTRGGFDCRPGVAQLPWADYALPCRTAFTGDNGGPTARGVTRDTIVIARRKFPESANSRAVDAFAEQAGAASKETADAVRNTFIDYFNGAFELYGRRVVFVDYEASPQSNSTEEAQSRGKEGACVDATKAAKEIKAFGIYAASGPFGECAAEQKLVGFNAGAYFPEAWYRKHHPYLWYGNGVMECERISHQVAEYIGKRLAKQPAQWAGDPVYQKTERVFGTYVPNNDEYQHCVNISERELQSKHGTKVASRYNYTLDVSRFPDEAARGVVQFKAAGVTTLINACDPISTTFLTQSANSQGWHPEWLIIGVATQDVDSVARLYEPAQVDGHLFGMSQLGDQSKLWGPDSEPGKTFKQITGKDIPAGTTGDYFTLVAIFNFLQAAGPNLTAETMAAGIRKVPPLGTKTRAVGYVSYQDGPDGTAGAGDHSGIDDSREVYWCASCKSKVDGKPGAYVETYGGKRFRNGEWPKEPPPIYPKA